MERSRGMRRERRSRKKPVRSWYNAKQRLSALFLAAMMTLSGTGVNPAVVYGAEASGDVTFSVSGTELVRAVREAVAEEQEVFPEDLEFTNGKTEKFENLFFGEGRLFEAYPELDEDGGRDAEMRVFVHLTEEEAEQESYRITGDEELIFLYVNNTDDTISCRTEVTRTERDGDERSKKTGRVTIKGYEAAFGEEEVEIVTEPATPSQAERAPIIIDAAEEQAEKPAEELTAEPEISVKEPELVNAALKDEPATATPSQAEEAGPLEESNPADEESKKQESTPVSEESSQREEESLPQETESTAAETLPQESESEAEAEESLPRATESTAEKTREDEVPKNLPKPGKNDLAGLDWCSTVKVTVTSLNQLRAFEDIEGYLVDYFVEPGEELAQIEGPDMVADGECLYFSVIPEDGYEITSVTVNGEDAFQVLREEIASASQARTIGDEGQFYKMPPLEENAEVLVEVEEIPQVMPAAVYRAETEDVIIEVSVPEGAFEEPVELTVDKIQAEDKLDSIQEQAAGALENGQAVSRILAYDVFFRAEESQETREPMLPVDVKMNLKQPVMDAAQMEEENASLSVVHIPQGDQAEMVAEAETADSMEFAFGLDSFSPIVLVLSEEAKAEIVGGESFGTIQAAVDAAENGDTIRLLAEASNSGNKGENLNLEGRTLTFDLNGHTWTGKREGSYIGDVVPGIASVITASNSNLTIIGSGTIQANANYRAFTLTDTNLTIGTEGEENGPQIRGNESTSSGRGITRETTEKNKGGVIFAQGGSIAFNSGTITDGYVRGTGTSDTAKAYGGGIAVLNGTFTMNGGSIEGNMSDPGSSTAPNNVMSVRAVGGGVYLENASFIMSGGTLSGNMARTRGNSWKTNSYGGHGGGIYGENAEISIGSGALVDGNMSRGHGGGIYGTVGSTIIVEGTVSDNTAIGRSSSRTYGSGGGIYNSRGVIQVKDGSVTGNTSSYSYGGGLYCTGDGGKIEISGGEISENQAAIGGGVYVANPAALEMSGGEVRGNTAQSGDGGGIYMAGTQSAQISGGEISDNEASSGMGGGIYFRGYASGGVNTTELNLDNVTISGNQASFGGAAAAEGAKAISISKDTKTYNNTAAGDGVVQGTTAHISDEFFIGSDIETSAEFAKDTESENEDATIHVIQVNGIDYILGLGGNSSNGDGIGYYNIQEINVSQEECILQGDVYLDPEKVSSHFLWNAETEQAELLTEENGLSLTLADAVEKASRTAATGTIYICSPVTISAADEADLNQEGITFKRCPDNHTGALMTVSQEETVDLQQFHMDGGNVTADTAMIVVPSGTTLNLESDSVVLENGNNTSENGRGGALCVFGTLNMDGGEITGSQAKFGGGVYLSGSGALGQFEGGTLSKNTANGGDGGAIYAGSDAQLKIGVNGGKTVITENRCTSQGGGITLYSSAVGWIYCADITNNFDELGGQYAAGGGIHVWAGGTLYMKNVFITGNESVHGAQYGALYSCPTGKLAIFEIDGALAVDNGQNSPDIMFNNTSGENQAFVSNVALGGGDVKYYTDSQRTSLAEQELYQYSTESFSLYTEPAGEDVKNVAEAIAREAGVYMTGNGANGAGSAIANNGTLIIGTEDQSLQVVKNWEPEEENHPSEVLVYLTKTIDGVTTKVEGFKDGQDYVILNEENQWTHTWTNLSAVEGTDGEDVVTWGVAEAQIDGYESSMSGPELVTDFEQIGVEKLYRVTLTNSRIPEGEDEDKANLNISKEVYGEDSGQSFGFHVSLDLDSEESYAYYIIGADGTRGQLQPIYHPESISFDLKDGETFTIEGLPLGTRYQVSEDEDSREGYLTYIDGELDEDGATEGTLSGDSSEMFANVETVNVQGSKSWRVPDGTQLPDEIQVYLLRNGAILPGYEQTATEEDGWTFIWKNLPKYDLDGELYRYSVDEEELPAYSKETGALSDYQFFIRNTLRTGTFDVKVYKTLTGKDLQTVEPFTFTLKDSSGTVVATASNASSVDEAGKAEIAFSQVPLPEYDGVGEYTYTIAEKADNRSGYIYDTTEIPVNVHVSVDETDDSRLNAVVEIAGASDTFVNEYRRGNASFTPAFVKHMQGREFNSSDSFTFTMIRTEPDGTQTREQKVISPDSGTVYEDVFSTSVFGMDDIGKTYRYEIYEETGSASNVTYDTRHYQIEVTVLDEGNENLTVSVKADGQDFEQAVFTNTYTAPSNPGGGNRPGGGGGSSSGGGRYTPESGGPGVTSADSAAGTIPPLSELPTVIEPEDAALAPLPKTGQTMKAAMVPMMTGIVMMVTALTPKRKKDEE